MQHSHTHSVFSLTLFPELANALRRKPNFTVEDIRTSRDSVFDMEFDVRKVGSLIRATADYKFSGRIKNFKNIVNLIEIYMILWCQESLRTPYEGSISRIELALDKFKDKVPAIKSAKRCPHLGTNLSLFS